MDEVRPVIEEFAERMFGGFARRDQRTKGQLYLRGLMLDGKRKSMQPMAQRLGVDHQQLQQFVTTSTWDHIDVRRRLASWAGEFVDPDALVIDDTGFPKDGKDSPGVARMYCGALGKTGNCQVGVSVHAVTDWASAAIDWRLFLPESWDDAKATEGEAAAEIRRRRDRSAIPEAVRHREKWRLALDMLDETITEWGLPRRPVVADAGYGDATEFRLGLTERGLTYALAVSPTATAHPAEAAPATPAWTGTGRPPQPRYPDPAQDLKSLVMAAGRSTGRFVVWRHGSRKSSQQPDRKHAITVPRAAGPSGQPQHPPRQRREPARMLAAGRMATRGTRTHRLLALHPPRRDEAAGSGAAGQDPLAHRTRLPRTQRRPRPRPLRRPLLDWLAPPRHPRRGGPGHLHPAPPHPKSPCAGLSLYAVLRELQALLAVWTGVCHTCRQPIQTRTPGKKPQLNNT
jgi:hypothetical protein